MITRTRHGIGVHGGPLLLRLLLLCVLAALLIEMVGCRTPLSQQLDSPTLRRRSVVTHVGYLWLRWSSDWWTTGTRRPNIVLHHPNPGVGV